ncbi:MAG: SEC-C metal-binding domain-containing protein, partial [Candidatus Dormibacteria bacterium]
DPLAVLLRRRDRLFSTPGCHDARLAVLLAEIADHPRAPHHPDIDLDEVLGLLAECRANLGDLDGAIEALERAIAAGWSPVPDPRCDLAEYHLRAGRRDHGAALLEEVRLATPDDVWLYNSAGVSYQIVGDHQTGLAWLTQGLELALSGDDPEDVVAQLTELRQESLRALGIGDTDALNDRADLWLAERRSRGMGRMEREDLPPGAESRPRGAAVAAMAWVVAEDFSAAREAWSDFREDWTELTHPEYCRRLEGKASELRSGGLVVKAMAPLRLVQYLPWAADQGLDPTESATRSHYAAELLRLGGAVAWPPGRNEPCWCGSGRKYKKCCASPQVPLTPSVV